MTNQRQQWECKAAVIMKKRDRLEQMREIMRCILRTWRQQTEGGGHPRINGGAIKWSMNSGKGHARSGMVLLLAKWMLLVRQGKQCQVEGECSLCDGGCARGYCLECIREWGDTENGYTRRRRRTQGQTAQHEVVDEGGRVGGQGGKAKGRQGGGQIPVYRLWVAAIFAKSL